MNLNRNIDMFIMPALSFVIKMLSLKYLYLTLYTVRYLKFVQIYFRFLRKFNKPNITDTFQHSLLNRSDKWKHHTLYECKIDSKLNAKFLNREKELDLPNDWNNVWSSLLWTYNLHYFDDLMSHNALNKKGLHLQLLMRWINENPVGCGIGWEPYPSSLRIVNILKAWLGGLNYLMVSRKIYFTGKLFI